MDYSVFYPSILLDFCILLAGSVLALALLVYADYSHVKEFFREKNFMNALDAVFFVAATVLVLYFSTYVYRDIPHVVNSDYIITTGTALGNNSAGKEPENRGFALMRDDTHEVVRITVTYYPIYKGDWMEVIFLPHTHLGAVIQKLD